MIVDSHLHVWDRNRSAYSWLEGAGPQLNQDFALGDVMDALEESGVDRVVLVQADDSRNDTRVMIDAAHDPRVAGIVASVPLEDTERTASELEWFAGQPGVRGVRVLNHDRADPEWLLQPAQSRSVELIARAGLPFDVVAVRQDQLDAALRFADAHPDLVVVLDHLGKPPLGAESAAWQDWSRSVSALGERDNVVAKLSGFYSSDASLPTHADLEPVFATALDAFGPQRLMLGSDWPMCTTVEEVREGGVGRLWASLDRLADELSPPEGDEIRGATATRIYRLELQP